MGCPIGVGVVPGVTDGIGVIPELKVALKVSLPT
jgi:hypothetical protein